MKVHIGPYKNWVGPYQIADKIFFWVDRQGIYAEEPERHKRWDYRAAERFGDWLADTWVNDFCNWIHSKKPRKVKIRIDPYDTWSMDHTLALIILPMLKQLKATKHGSPLVDDEDVPEHLRSTSAPAKENEWDTDANHHVRWDWVIDEMIWSFEQELNDDANDAYYDAYGKDEPTEAPITVGVIQEDGTIIEKPFEWDTEELRRKRGKLNTEKRLAFEQRKANGFKLFGKYYQALWD